MSHSTPDIAVFTPFKYFWTALGLYLVAHAKYMNQLCQMW